MAPTQDLDADSLYLVTSMIHSKDAGSIMVIPREDNLVRLYVQLQKGEGEAGQNHIGSSLSFAPARLQTLHLSTFTIYAISNVDRS